MRTQDRSFAIIAVARNYVAREAVAEAERDLDVMVYGGETDVTLAELLVTRGKLSEAKRKEIERSMRKHALECAACAKLTYILPKQDEAKIVCEHCGGATKRPGTREATEARRARLRAKIDAVEKTEPAPAATSVATATDPERPAEAKTPEPENTPALERKPEAEKPEPEKKPEPEAAPRARNLRRDGAGFGSEEVSPEAIEAERQARLRRLSGGVARSSEPVAPGPVAAADGELAAVEDAPRQLSFAPPAAELAAMRPPPPPRGGLADDLALALRMPLDKDGLVRVGLAAVFLGVASFMFKNSWMAGSGGFGIIFTYFAAYYVKTLNAGTQGKTELPDWPEFTEILGLGWRILLTILACFVPFIVSLILVFKMYPERSDDSFEETRIQSIGPSAEKAAGRGERYMGLDLARCGFMDLDDNNVVVGERKGRWLVLGLVGRDDGSDPGTMSAQDIADMPKNPGMGILIQPAYQVFDLARVARSFDDVDVWAAYADPRGFILRRKFGIFPGKAPSEPEHREERPRFHEEDDPNEDVGAGRMPDLPMPGPPRRGRGAFMPRFGSSGVPTELAGLKIVRTRGEMTFPEPLDKAAKIPQVFIVDPTGHIKKSWDSGAHDKMIYATVKSLKKGGNADVSPEDLPARAYAGELAEAPRASSGGGAIRWVIWIVCLLLMIAFLIIGFLLEPMAFLMMAVFNDWRPAWNYPGVLHSISRVKKEYVLLFLFFVAFSAALPAVTETLSIVLALSPLPWIAAFVLGGLVHYSVVVYGNLVCAFALGRFYHRNERRIGWFGGGEDPEPAFSAPAYSEPAFSAPVETAPEPSRFAPPPELPRVTLRAPDSAPAPAPAPRPADDLELAPPSRGARVELPPDAPRYSSSDRPLVPRRPSADGQRRVKLAVVAVACLIPVVLGVALLTMGSSPRDFSIYLSRQERGTYRAAVVRFSGWTAKGALVELAPPTGSPEPTGDETRLFVIPWSSLASDPAAAKALEPTANVPPEQLAERLKKSGLKHPWIDDAAALPKTVVVGLPTRQARGVYVATSFDLDAR